MNQGTGSSLLFFWAVNGLARGDRGQRGTTDAAPSMTVNGHAVNISTVGTANQLLFYWAVNGTATWHPETVAGPGGVA